MPRGRPKKRKHSSSVPPCLQSPEKHLKWSNESMVKAIDAVKSGRCSVKRPAEDYKVPRTTLQDRISGRVIHGTKPGPLLHLNKGEESELAQFLLKYLKLAMGRQENKLRVWLRKLQLRKVC